MLVFAKGLQICASTPVRPRLTNYDLESTHKHSLTHTNPFVLTVLHHQLRLSVDSLCGDKTLLALALCIKVTEERRYEGIIKPIPSITDNRLGLRLMMLVMMLVMMVVKLMKV